MEKSNLSVSIFIPVYNEEKILEENIMKIINKVDGLKDYEIIIVDDSSTDSTYNISQELPDKIKRLRTIRFDNGPTRRENLSKAILSSTKDIIVYLDIDLSTDLFYFNQLIDNLSTADISIGSRRMGVKPKRFFFRKAISKIYHVFLRYYFKSRVRDYQCGFKAFKREVIFELIKDVGYDYKHIRGWFWDAEILLRAEKKGFIISEFPVTWSDSNDCKRPSSFSIFREFKILPCIFKLKKELK